MILIYCTIIILFNIPDIGYMKLIIILDITLYLNQVY